MTAPRALPFRDPAAPVARSALASLLLCAGFLPGGAVGLAAGVIGLTVAFLLGVSAAILRRSARRWRAELDAIGAGDFLVHWTYTPEAWARFAAAEGRRGRGRVALAAVLPAAAVLPVAHVTWEEGARLGGAWTHSGAALLAASLLGLLAGSAAVATRRRALRGGPRECFVGRAGVYRNARYWPFASFGRDFRGAHFEAGPPAAVVFRFEVTTRGGTMADDLRVPVPEGREPEAQALADRLRAG